MPQRPRPAAVVLLAYAVALSAIAFWPVPVDSGAGPLLRAITRVFPVLTYDRIEFAANIALFIPFGVLVTQLVRQAWLVLPLGFLTTLMIETAQALLLDRRTPSILDLVANMAGVCVGLLVVVFVRWLQEEHQVAAPVTAMPPRPRVPASRR
ncbi:VanZ family protein [Microbacterium sp. NPDC077184]|uniref:VanZ family protein n=1 Tax=Microbacterium sp. NPDC077184 TaxID=3154764 RepID=UPI00344A5B6F